MGALVNYLSSGRLLQHPEQRPDFVIPERYLQSSNAFGKPRAQSDGGSTSDAPTRIPSSERVAGEKDADLEAHPEGLEKALETAENEIGDHILVDWYGEDDPENPQNWSLGKRAFVIFEICFLTYA